MRIVQGHHDSQILLDSGHKELKGGLVLILFAHFILELGKERFKLFRCVQAWYLAS
jgi:hypothetical protein